MKTKKLKSEYECGDLPEPCITSCDIELYVEDTDAALSFFKYLKDIGAGEIFTQVDSMAANHPDVLYSRGLHVVNRTGVYAFVFGHFSPEKVGGKVKSARKNETKHDEELEFNEEMGARC